MNKENRNRQPKVNEKKINDYGIPIQTDKKNKIFNIFFPKKKSNSKQSRLRLKSTEPS